MLSQNAFIMPIAKCFIIKVNGSKRLYHNGTGVPNRCSKWARFFRMWIPLGMEKDKASIPFETLWAAVHRIEYGKR
jgi:hypothetical protein